MKAVLIAGAPAVTPKATDAASGFVLADQPVQIAGGPLQYDDGTALVTKDPKSGTWRVDAAAAQVTFSYGALLFRLDAAGVIAVFDGTAWQPENAFDAFAAGAKPTELALDVKTGTWSGTVVLSAMPGMSDPSALTDPGSGRPRYGFLTVFRTPKTSPAAPVRSPRSAPLPITTTAASRRVSPVPVLGTDPAQDLKNADGFAVFVKDASGFVATEMLLTTNASQPDAVTLRYAQGGIERASVTIAQDGTLALSSAIGVTVTAPSLAISGELQAHTVRYVAASDGLEHVL